MIPVSNIGPETAILLQQKLDAGRMGGYRWRPHGGKPSARRRKSGDLEQLPWQTCALSAGALCAGGRTALSGAADVCPARAGATVKLHCEPFADPLLLPRATRQQALQEAVDRYAARLEHHALIAPLDWFNFFDFWQLPDQLAR